jgi:DNA-sulfur modification-associated
LALHLDNLTGYDTDDRYFASLYSQGTRRVYSLDLSLAGIVATLPRPDPDHPAPGNRKIDPKHARDFGAYVREKRDWVCPAVILRAPEVIFSFEKQAEVGDSEFGIISVPRIARTDLRVLDGQHRILGLHMAYDDIANELAKARQELHLAQTNSPDQVAHIENVIKNLLMQRDRFTRERISVQIVLEDDERGYKQMFVDIAENAKGITKTLQARFDSRKVVNRALLKVIQHPLLNGRIEDQLDRVKTEQQFLAAKHVAEIIRAVAVGVGGRISRKKEEQLDEDELVATTDRFFSILAEAYPELQAIADGTLAPGELRGDGPKGSLLGSATMLRVLAGVYHELSRPTAQRGESTPDPWTDDQIVAFLATLRPDMTAPVAAGLWTDTGLVEAGAHAPRARGGDISRLGDHVLRWARHGLPVTTAA